MNSARQSVLAYALLLPAILIMALCGILPMAFVAYYSVHDTFGGNSFIWVGADWFGHILTAHVAQITFVALSHAYVKLSA